MENNIKTILVVEDDMSLSRAIEIKLEKNDFRVITSATVDDAIKNLENDKSIVAIWLDHYLLGQENGLDFVIKLKSRGDNLKNIPIFVVSNTANPDKVKSYITLGVSKYYLKAENRLEDIINDIKSFTE